MSYHYKFQVILQVWPFLKREKDNTIQCLYEVLLVLQLIKSLTMQYMYLYTTRYISFQLFCSWTDAEKLIHDLCHMCQLPPVWSTLPDSQHFAAPTYCGTCLLLSTTLPSTLGHPLSVLTHMLT